MDGKITWLLLLISLSGSHGALRLRVWRALKAMGAAVVRDGVYLAPGRETVHQAFKEQAKEIIEFGGSAFVFDVSADTIAGQEPTIIAMFDRSVQYKKCTVETNDFIDRLQELSEGEARRSLRQLSRDFVLIENTDFFPGPPRELAVSALEKAQEVLARTFSPEEPVAVHAKIPQCDAAKFQGKTWATRSHLWVDRVCSAWLIRRFIDRRARFIWIDRVADCPESAIGFDFDGAQFTHIEDLVTFEVLVRGFSLQDDRALDRIATLVHQLDVGEGRVPEAAGFEAILTGARKRCNTDDALLEAISKTLDDLYAAFI